MKIPIHALKINLSLNILVFGYYGIAEPDQINLIVYKSMIYCLGALTPMLSSQSTAFGRM